MKIKLINNNLSKAIKNRTNLVKVAKQIQGKTGAYQSHRWINPDKALDILKNDLLKQGIKEINNLTFEDKKTKEKITDKAMLEVFKKDKSNKTIQQFVRDNYNIKAESTKPKISANKEVNPRILKRRMTLDWDRLPSLTSTNTLRARRGRKQTLHSYLDAIEENPEKWVAEKDIIENETAGEFWEHIYETNTTLDELKDIHDNIVLTPQIPGDMITKEEALNIARTYRKNEKLEPTNAGTRDYSSIADIVKTKIKKELRETLKSIEDSADGEISRQAITEQVQKANDVLDLMNSTEVHFWLELRDRLYRVETLQEILDYEAIYKNKYKKEQFTLAEIEAKGHTLNEVNWNYKDGKIIIDGSRRKQPWLAELKGLDDSFGFDRNFVSSYTEEFPISEGIIYNCQERGKRHFFIAENGKTYELSEEQAKELLQSKAESKPTEENTKWTKEQLDNIKIINPLQDKRIGDLPDDKLIFIPDWLADEKVKELTTDSGATINKAFKESDIIQETEKAIKVKVKVRGYYEEIPTEFEIWLPKSQIDRRSPLDQELIIKAPPSSEFASRIENIGGRQVEGTTLIPNNMLEEAKAIIEEVFGVSFPIPKTTPNTDTTKKQLIDDTTPKRYIPLKLGTKTIKSDGSYAPAKDYNDYIKSLSKLSNLPTEQYARSAMDLAGFGKVPFIYKENGVFTAGRLAMAGYCKKVFDTAMEIAVSKGDNSIRAQKTTHHEISHAQMPSGLSKPAEEALVEIAAFGIINNQYDNQLPKMKPSYIHYVVDMLPRLATMKEFQGAKNIYQMGEIIAQKLHQKDTMFIEKINKHYESTKSMSRKLPSLMLAKYDNRQEYYYDNLNQQAKEMNANSSKLSDLVEELKRGTISMEQAMYSSQYVDVAPYLLFLMLEEDDEIGDLLSFI